MRERERDREREAKVGCVWGFLLSSKRRWRVYGAAEQAIFNEMARLCVPRRRLDIEGNLYDVDLKECKQTKVGTGYIRMIRHTAADAPAEATGDLCI